MARTLAMIRRPVGVAEWGVVAVAGTHLAIGAWLIDRLSLWGDEAFTAETVRLPLTDLLPMLSRIDINMSAYYLLVRAGSSVLGDSEVSLRLPSLLMTTATVLVVAWLVSRWFGPMSGLVAAIAVGLSPYFLVVGLTARPFAMLALLTAISLSCFVRALGRSEVGPWLTLAIVNVLALYTSLLAVLLIAAETVHLVALDRRLRRAQLAAVGVLILGALPTLFFLAPADTLNWLGTTSVLRVLYTVIGSAPGLLLAALVLLGLASRPRATGEPLASLPRGRLLLPALTVVPLLLMLALQPVQTLFTPPYLVATFVTASMLAGAVLVTVRPSWAWMTAAALATSLLAGIAVSVVPQPGFADEDWSSAVAALDEVVRPGDAVAFPNTFYRVAGEHYARGGTFTEVATAALPTSPWFSQVPYEYDRLKRTGYYRDADHVTAELAASDRVWLVGPDDEFMKVTSGVLAESGWTAVDERDFSDVTVRLFAR